MNDRRIRVSTATRAFIDDQERSVLVVGLSSRTALFVTDRDAGAVGATIRLLLPAVGRELEMLAGIDRVEKTDAGFAVAVAFIVAEQSTRSALNELMQLLLAGDGGGSRTHPRVIYDVAIRSGPMLAQHGRLEEISIRGAGVRIAERIPPGNELTISLPDFASQIQLVLATRVVNQRLSREGGYHTGLEFVNVDAPTRKQLARLLADLLCR